jgi:hypothetical protein
MYSTYEQTKAMSNMDPTKNLQKSHVLVKDNMFLFLIIKR